ncbi:MAG: hypothetical protein ACJ75J_18430 [Cytophagaceae bacterium]
MDHLAEIIHTFSKEDKKKFRIFLNRYRKKDSRKDLDLFILLAEGNEKSGKEILGQLYAGDNNTEAYHATRKRLLKQLVDFTSLKTKGNADMNSHILSLITISEYLFAKNREEAGWHFIVQAEKLAQKSAHYELLNAIFSIQIERSQSEFAPDLKEIMRKKRSCQELAIREDNANTANQLIRYELNSSLATGKEIDIGVVIRKVLKEYNLTNAVIQNPRLMYNLVAITRTAILAKKDFYSFEPYIIQRYQAIEKKNIFNQYNHFYKVNLLYMICHVLYRNKKFSQALEYLRILHGNMLDYRKSHYYLLYPKYALLLSATYNYSNKNDKAISILEELLLNREIKLDKAQVLNINLNLALYYFQKEDYRRPSRLFLKMDTREKWILKNMGREWVLKKSLMECINHYELGNNDLVENKIRWIEKNFDDYFQRPAYKRALTFLSLLKKLTIDPGIAHTREFRMLVEGSFKFIDVMQEDLQAIAFFAWLKSKILKKKFYPVLLEIVSVK